MATASSATSSWATPFGGTTSVMSSWVTSFGGLLLLCLLEVLLSGGLLLLCLLEVLLSGGLLLLSDGLLLLGLRLSGGLLLLDFLPRSLGLYFGLSLGLLLREALLPVLLCEALLRLLCLSLSWPVAGDIVRLLGIWGIQKAFDHAYC